MNKISEHISYTEGIKSNTALRLGIENKPGEYELQNMELIAEKVFEPLRKAVNGPIKINSFYRCEKLNKAIGGSSKSQHCQGRAIDIDDIYGYVSNSYMYHYIKDNLDFDQLIWEFGTEENPDWIHVSYVDADSNRKRCLKAIKENGKTKYIDITNV
jgi:zinc D-Ala-D-Ala carboxypeptidase